MSSHTPIIDGTAQQVELAGCFAAAGADAGPVDVTYPGSREVSEQASTVVFTNPWGTPAPITPAAGVMAQPTFTG